MIFSGHQQSESDCWQMPGGSVEKLSPKESVEGAAIVLRGSVRAPNWFSKGKHEAAKPRGGQGFAAKGLPEENPTAQCRHPRYSPDETVFPLCPKDFQQLLRLPKSCSLLANEASPLAHYEVSHCAKVSHFPLVQCEGSNVP